MFTFMIMQKKADILLNAEKKAEINNPPYLFQSGQTTLVLLF